MRNEALRDPAGQGVSIELGQRAELVVGDGQTRATYQCRVHGNDQRLLVVYLTQLANMSAFSSASEPSW